MKITKIESYADNPKFLKIYSEDGYLLSVSADIAKKFSLEEGFSLSAEILNAVNKASLARKARERLLYCVERRPYSEYELRQKLKRDYPADAIDEAIQSLKELSLIDDLHFARVYAKHLADTKQKGRYYIKDALFAKGIDAKTAEEVLGEIFKCRDETELALSFLESRYQRELGFEQRAKAYNALVRRGFSFDTAKSAVRIFCDGEK